MRTLSLVLACAFVGLALSSTSMWQKVDDIEPADHHHFNFKIGFKKQNIDVLDGLYNQMTDMNSPLFGTSLTNDQIKDLVSLPDADIAEVEAYLMKDSGKFCDVLVRRSVHQDYLLVDTCAAQANVIFPNLDLVVYRKQGSGHLVLRHSIMMDVGYNMYLLGFPHQLHKNVEAIYDITDIPVHHTRAGSYPDQGPFNPQKGWQPTVTEQTVETMIKYFGITYDGIKDSTYAADNSQVRQGVIEFNNAPFSASGLASFQKTYHTPSNPIRKVVGTEESHGESIEANLDVQTITALSGKAQTWDFVFGATASFNDVIETLMTTDGAPKVYSCSWGGTDSDYTQTSANSINQDFLKLATSGTTFLIASGDSGPTLGSSCKKFNPQFPVGSAYVVAVGGTVLDQGLERCWEDSSGGFSGLITRPAHQDSAVENYLKTSKLPSNSNDSVYNTTGRAYPDVAAFGAFEPVFNGSDHVPIGGTSGACPQFAAIITLVNLHRYQNGKGPLGGLGKTLYQLKNGVGFDVVKGETYATNRNVFECGYKYLPGFLSGEGWDATTGLGSPRFKTLLDQLVQVPGESN